MELKLHGISYKYKVATPLEKEGVEDINITIRNNEFIVIIGETGSGKSTLAQILANLLVPQNGIFNTNKYRVGMVFQFPEQQFFKESVYKEIAFGLESRNLGSKISEKKVLEICEFLNIEKELLNVSPIKLSGGEKRRVAIASIIITKPELLILDEPTVGLDCESTRNLLAYLSNLQKKGKISIIIISHDLKYMLEYTKRIILLNKGKIIYDKNTERFISEYKSLLKDYKIKMPKLLEIMDKLNKLDSRINSKIYNINEAANEIVKREKEL